MSMRRTVLALALLAAACGPGERRVESGFAISGRLVDAGTGGEVSRERIWLHFFCDGIGFKETLDPARGSSFEVRTPGATVRARAYDPTLAYELYEQTFEVPAQGLRLDLALVPTGYVLVTGRLTGAEPTGPPEDIGSTPLVSLVPTDGRRAGAFDVAADGTYRTRVPRTLLRVEALDTAKSPRDPFLDLTGFEGDEAHFDIALE